jgi:hypothetical protein
MVDLAGTPFLCAPTTLRPQDFPVHPRRARLLARMVDANGWHVRCFRSPLPGGRVDRLARGLEPDFRKEDGGSGQEPRAGRQPESRQAPARVGETPGTSRGGFIAVKVVGGEDVKASSRRAE